MTTAMHTTTRHDKGNLRKWWGSVGAALALGVLLGVAVAVGLVYFGGR